MAEVAGSCGKASTKKKKEIRKLRADFFLIVSGGVYLSEEAEGEDTAAFSEYNSDYDSYDDEEEIYSSNRRKGAKCGRSTSKNAKPKANPNHLVRASQISKSERRKTHISRNHTAQKENIDSKLNEKGIHRTGYEMYEKRSPTSTAPSTKSTQAHPTVSRSKTRRKHSLKEEDHPAALRYELHSDNIPKDAEGYMQHIVDLQHRELTPEDYELLLQLDTSVAPKTISQSILSSIVVVTVESADIIGELCTICMEMYQSMQSVKSLPCRHTFHAQCIDMWLSCSSPNCPLDGLEIYAT